MNKRIVKVQKPNQGSFLRNLEQATGQVNYPLVPRNYTSIGESLKNTEQYRNEIETQLKHSDFYLKTRKLVRERVFGKKVKTIEELFNLQLGAMRGINYGLEIINNEARQRLSLLERYIEKINYEYEHNFLGIDSKKNSLNPILKDYIWLYQRFNSLTKKDKDYFDVERGLRDLKRRLSEGGLAYKKMLDVVDDFEKERNSLNALEDFFRHSIHLSERMVAKAKRFENHVANTKDAYIMARDINCGFAAVLKAIQNSSSTISQLQQVLTEGLKEMGDAVSDPNLPAYAEFEMLLKSRYDAVRSLVNQSDQDKERLIEMEKKGLIK